MRKIAVITGTRAEYGYLKPLMSEIQKDKMQVIDDTFWKGPKDTVDSPTVKKTIDGKQVSGNIIIDWKFSSSKEYMVYS